jgi:hypothetical protein
MSSALSIRAGADRYRGADAPKLILAAAALRRPSRAARFRLVAGCRERLMSRVSQP